MNEPPDQTAELSAANLLSFGGMIVPNHLRTSSGYSRSAVSMSQNRTPRLSRSRFAARQRAALHRHFSSSRHSPTKPSSCARYGVHEDASWCVSPGAISRVGQGLMKHWKIFRPQPTPRSRRRTISPGASSAPVTGCRAARAAMLRNSPFSPWVSSAAASSTSHRTSTSCFSIRRAARPTANVRSPTKNSSPALVN